MGFKVTSSGGRGLRDLSNRLTQLSRGAQRLHGAQAVMRLEPDEEGFVDRECPHCHATFKVHETSLDEHSGELTCPYQGHGEAGDSWVTAAQRAAAHRQLKRHARQWIRGTLNGTNQGSLGRITQSPFGPRELRLLPAQARAALRQERECGSCSARFAFIGAAFFCPLCGDNSADTTFDQTLANLRRLARSLPELVADVDQDTGAEVSRTVLEKCLLDLVTAFQRVGESLYKDVAGREPPMNAFQRLSGGNSGDGLWRACTGNGYDTYLTADELGEVVVYFQRRHCLAHCDGIVDQKYVDRSGETTYAPGQRLRVRAAEVLRFAELVEQLVDGMRRTRDTRR